MSVMDVLIATGDANAAHAASSSLLNSRFHCRSVCSALSELTSSLESEEVPAVVVDLDPQPGRSLIELESIIARFPRTRFVLMCDQPHNDLLLEGMRIGARHFMAKSTLGTLSQVLNRLVGDSTAEVSKGGSVVTVLSSGGGCGATMTAVNLANEMALELGQPVLLVDMDCSYGSIAPYLGLRGSYGLADVLAHRHIDPQLIHSCASVCGSLHVLLSPVSVDSVSPSPLEYSRLGEFLDACKRGYACTVIDAPRVGPDVAFTLSKASQCALLVMQLTVKDLSVAKSASGALIHRGLSPDAIRPVISRYVKRNPMVDLDVAKEALGSDHLMCLSNDFRSAVRAVNYGKPLSVVAPSSPLRKDVQRLAQSLLPQRASAGRNTHE